MDLMGLIRGKSLSRFTTVGLTELGKKKTEQFDAEGPRFAVLNYLDDNGPSSIEEIGERTGMGSRKAARVVERLVKEHQVRVIKGGEGE